MMLSVLPVDVKQAHSLIRGFPYFYEQKVPRLFQNHQNIFPGPSQSSSTFRYKHKQQLLTAHTAV